MQKTQTTPGTLKLTGIALLITGFLYTIVQFIHPMDTIPNTASQQWLIVHVISLIMDAAAIIGIVGLFTILGKSIGWVGKTGLGLFMTFWFLIFGFHFAEAFILPTIANSLPEFVSTWQGLITGETGTYTLTAVSVVYSITGITYILGGIISGIAISRSNVLSRTAGIILAVGSALTVLGAVIPHPLDRVMALPVAAALFWIGISALRLARAK